MVGKLERNRFSQGITPQISTGGTAQAKHTEAAGEVLRYSAQQAGALLGSGSPVLGRRITTEEFIAKVKQAKEAIVNAPRFEIAFQEQILKDPILSTAFGGYLELVRSGTLGVSAEKKLDAEVIFNRQQVVQFLETFQMKLEALKETREATPVDLTQLGLRLIQRNNDIQETIASPLENAPALKEMAALDVLGPEQQKTFLLRLAKAAVQEVSVEANRTPEKRTAALDTLEHALRKLVSLGETGDTFREYFGEAMRLAKELDGNGTARRIKVEAIRLSSTKDTDRKAASGRIESMMGELTEARKKTQTAGTNLSAEQIASFGAVLEASKRSRTLFEKMPDFIELITGAPSAAKGDAAEYAASQAEIQAKQQMTAAYVGSIGAVFPSLTEASDRDAHKAACEHAQGLILEHVGTDLSPNISVLIGQLTRHPELSEKALELLGAEFITNDTYRLNAASSAVIALLENRQIDAAYKLFTSQIFDTKDAQSLVRQGNVFSKATQVAIDSQMDVKASQVSTEWLATAHIRAVEASTQNPPNLLAIKETLKNLTRGEFKLDGQSAADLIGKIQQAFAEQGTQHMDFLPGMISLLAQHPESDAAMSKAKELIELGMQELQSAGKGTVKTKFHTNYQYDISLAAVDLLEAVSKCEQLSGFIKPLAQTIVDYQMPSASLAYFQRIGKLGQFADKDDLSRLPTVDDASLPKVALALSFDVSTTQYARELIARFATAHNDAEIKDLTPEQRAGFLQVEAAARLAVPNLMSAKALVGLVKAFQAKEVPKEALMVARAQLPREIIEQALKLIDNAEIRDFLTGTGGRKARDKGGEVPDESERLPVAVVQGSAKPPKEE